MAFLSLVSAQRNFSERVGSQCILHIYFKIQVFKTDHCHDVMNFVCS